ncbi:ATP-binding protein [Taklimakanibacter deserti]|uniref:ATP-binding protein n=1 Tax=Taklimakanibacter deserti TaxID=2267839 RepID=UPI000E655A62
MKRLFPQSLPAWILLILVAGLIATQALTLVIAAHGVSNAGRSFELFRLGERTVALAKAFHAASPDLRQTLLTEMANPSLTLAMSGQPAVATALPSDDELAELEDILVAKLAKNGVTDIRVREDGPSRANRPPSNHAAAPIDQPGDVEELLLQAASTLGKSGRFTVAIQFSDGQWLNFATPVTPDPPVLTQESMPLYGGAAIAIILLSLWTIRQLTAPYGAFERAVSALGDDLNRPPLPETGSGEVKAAVKAVNAMQAKLQDYVAEREHLAAALAHDLRTPITRLRLRFELLKKKSGTPALLADLQEIEKIIQSVVDFASHEVKKEPDAKIDLVSLVEAVCDDYPDVRLDQKATPPRILCSGRPIALKRCLTNLIDNAVKYGKRASVSIEEAAQNINVVIEDEGQGLAQSDIEQVFKPFKRLEGSRNRETGGIGLGLAIARGIARAHLGDISMYRREESGMRVVLSLPKVA